MSTLFDELNESRQYIAKLELELIQEQQLKRETLRVLQHMREEVIRLQMENIRLGWHMYMFKLKNYHLLHLFYSSGQE